MKKFILVFAVLVGSFFMSSAYAQWDYPVDVYVGQKWTLSPDAAWYGGARTYFPLDIELFGVTPNLSPEVGIDYNTLEPFATLELSLNAEYGTAAAWVTYMGGYPRINIEFRTCFLSDKCGE